MKKSSFALILLTANVCLVCGQNAVEKYNEIVDSAEILICKKDYSPSLLMYEKAFSLSIKEAHTIDLYNATQCAIATKDFKKVKYFMDSLVLRGFTLNYFLLKSVFKEFRGSVYWSQFLESYPEIRQSFVEKVDWRTRAKIEALYAGDQQIRIDNINYATQYKDTLRSIDSANTSLLLLLLKENGFPSDKKIGVFMQNDTVFSNLMMNTLVRHSYQNKDYRLTPLLTGFLESGMIKPDEFMNWHWFEMRKINKTGYGIEPYIVINGNVYKDVPGDDIRAAIDMNRKKRYGSSFDSYCRKIEMQFFNNPLDFRVANWGGIAIFGNLPEEEEKYFSQTMQKTIYRYGLDN